MKTLKQRWENQRNIENGIESTRDQGDPLHEKDDHNHDDQFSH
jgi:hypothetical protein